MNPTDAIQVAEQALEQFPEFAPFYLAIGDLRRDRKQTDAAIAAYRMGLELAAEPDLESRLLSALAGTLPKESPERETLIQRALSLKGSAVAQATAKLMGIL